MKHIKTIISSHKQSNTAINEQEIRYATSCKTSVTVGWQPQEKQSK